MTFIDVCNKAPFLLFFSLIAFALRVLNSEYGIAAEMGVALPKLLNILNPSTLPLILLYPVTIFWD